MRLSDLKPHWIGLAGWSAEEPFYIGVSFLCPHCPIDAQEHGPSRRKRLVVIFTPPIDPGGWLPRMLAPPMLSGAHRRVGGSSFDDLSIEPSIGYDHIGHWHGRITDGNVTP